MATTTTQIRPHGREGQVRAALEEAGLDGMLLVSPPNLEYVAGLRVTPWERLVLLVVAAGQPFQYVAPVIEEEHGRTQLGAEAGLHIWRDEDGPRAALASALDGIGPGARIGVEKAHLSVRWFELIASLLPGRDLVDCGPELARLRVTKDAGELAAHRKAAATVDQMMIRLPGRVQAGQSELEIAEIVGSLIREHGGDGFAFEPIVLVGENSALPHGHAGDRQLGAGELLLVDVGTRVDGYCADITRTFVLGRADDRQRELHALVDAARAAAIAACRPGAALSEADHAARATIEAAGLGAAFTHRTGHGLGVEVHEEPQVSSSSTDIATAGMVFTIEPGVYLPGWGGIRIEDDVAMHESGPEILTKAPIILELPGS